MIQALSSRCARVVAALLLNLYSLTICLPALAAGIPDGFCYHSGGYWPAFTYAPAPKHNVPVTAKPFAKSVNRHSAVKHPAIGGPSQPEMSSFKSVGTDNMVNLFTGDFSYNVPLMDVGGYPINIYYDGGISPEQEASWVGLGFNINPGNINRNTRGVPDDFNGQDTMQQLQIMKPNRTWGFSTGGDVEVFGIKNLEMVGDAFDVSLGATIGVSFNNYLGPALDWSLRGCGSYKSASFGGSEKFVLNPKLNVGIDINSRAGTSFSGGVSMYANALGKYNSFSYGVGASTSYNSRSGVKALQISEQAGFNANLQKMLTGKDDPGHKSDWGKNETIYSTTISFVKPSYTPALRMPLTNTTWSGHFQFGLGSYGIAGDVEAEVFGQKSEVASADALQKKPMVGYLYCQNAVNNPNYVMDFTRFNDREVTPNTPIISVPQYCYDVFSIQGEGTGGSIRAYRNDLGYVRDNITQTKDKNLSVGADVDPPGHYGANFNTIKTPSTIGEWNTGNKLRSVIPFSGTATGFENVYFRNPGETSVADPVRLARVAGTDLVRFVLAGATNTPTIEPRLQAFTPTGKGAAIPISTTSPGRNKRSQVINFLTAAEATVVGLDKVIKNYNNTQFLDPVTDTLLYTPILRYDGVTRKDHHISQINVTESNGRRYIYGVPVYNLVQKDFTFSVDNAYTQTPDRILVNNPAETGSGSGLLNSSSSRDGYVQVTTTPAYAHSFLLSGILSPDYVDVTGNGISEDDLGDAVKFNYTRISGSHKWRAPLTAHDSASFHSGNRSEVKDDKASISYGERESWYLQSVESKTMIALFFVSDRSDGKGAQSFLGDVNPGETSLKKLDSIALYNKADLKANGLQKAKAIKTVHFTYNYQLCQNTPDNPSGAAGNNGKLTLQNIYFSYNGKTRAFKNRYSFYYSSTGTDNSADNPAYIYGAQDRWGNYKPASMNPGAMKNSDYPYSIQDAAGKTTLDQNAAAWMLKKIVLPSGGQIEVGYESDDYAFVQNKRAADMMQVVGFGNTNSFSASTDQLYPYQYGGGNENDYVFIRVPIACTSATDVYNKYLQGIKQLSFKIWVQMPKGPEYIPCYASFSGGAWGVSSDPNVIWIKMDRLGGKSPLSITTLEYLRQQLPGQAFQGYDVSDEPALPQMADMLLGMLKSLRDAFKDPVNGMRKDAKAMHTDLTKCFVRLNDPDGFKYGGGYRVKSVTLKDNWNAMTGQFTSLYGQRYDYTTTENFNGAVRTISSGVASYEPSIGGEENPFTSIIQVQDYLPLGPTSYGAVEMPVLDAFFPAPLVGYSKVTVRSVRQDTSATKKSRSGIGKQVTEYYTAKDFPVQYSYTPFDAASVMEFHQASTLSFFNKYGYDYKAMSQGFLVATNDMHGKLRSQSSYADNDSATRISYTEHFYRNTGVKGLNDQFSFISKDNNGIVSTGNMGIDIDLMTDTREFAVKSSSLELQGQVDILFLIVPVPIPTIWPVTGETENIYRAVTTTKVVNYHAVMDSSIIIDKGSQVSTKNLAYDAETGEVLVTRTNNEFNQPLYNTSYPAWWAYSGMGLAYKNIDAYYTGITFSDGRITNAGFDFSVLESGDELLILKGAVGSGCDAQMASATGMTLVWAYNISKNNTSLATTNNFIFLDADGKPYTMSGVIFRIIRSGHRNMLDAKAATVVSMANPLATGRLRFDTTSMVINASAAEYREKWQIDNDVIKRVRQYIDTVNCIIKVVEDSAGYLQKSINPYVKGLLGNFHSWRNRVFYDNRKEYDTSANTNIATNGFLANFRCYWDFNGSGALIPDSNSTQWVWNNRLNRINSKGMELETQDALGIYTSAQYGFRKTLPVAIASNARSTEMITEGFEDYGYNASLDNATYNIFRRQLDLSAFSNSWLVNTDSAGFRAHSGKYVLAIQPGASQQTTVGVSAATVFDMVPGRDTTSSLTEIGGILTTEINYTPANVYQPIFSSPGSSLGMQGYVGFSAPQLSSCQSGVYHTTQYFQVPTTGTYQITASFIATSDFPTITGTAYGWFIFPVGGDGNPIVPTNVSQQVISATGSYTSYETDNVCLPAGTYKLVTTYGGTLCNWYCSPCNSGVNYNYTVRLNAPFTSYKSLTKVNGCSYTVPVPGSDAMLNPLFSVPAGKQMLFTAWVHENCGNAASGIPCKAYTFTNNHVQLKFGGDTTHDVRLSPTGPIIDGWQRYEGTFSAPASATAMTINLVNNGAAPVYFDDIRIQPFNANVKSYVYDPINLRLVSELDANNYATFYEYDEEGTLVRTKVETRQGIKTVTETRSALQKVIQ